MVSKPIAVLIERLKGPKMAPLSTSSPDESLINVNRITERAGALYEKVRYLVDYKDERHIRRSALERIIKRKLIFEKKEAGIGLSLIQELIAGGYLPNNTIPESAVHGVERIVTKYQILGDSFPETFRRNSISQQFLISLLSSEIEIFFHPDSEDDYVVDAFYGTVRESVRVQTTLSEQMLRRQMLLACYRGLLNTDNETLLYKMWLRWNPDWFLLEHEAEIRAVGEKSDITYAQIKSAISDPISFRLIPKLSNYAIYFSVLRELIRAKGTEADKILTDEKSVDEFIRDFLAKNYTKQYSKAREGALRAVFYIFLTKVFLALAIEVGPQYYFQHTFDTIPVIINIFFHPLLLIFMTFSVRALGDKNTQHIIDGVHDILEGKEIRLIKLGSAQAGLFNIAFYMLYTFMFFIVFGFIVTVLREVRFNPMSIGLFVCFLALVSYFALRIRHSATRWKVTTNDERLSILAFNLFTLPIIRAGRWLSTTFSSINLFVFILDFIIETPFKLLLHFSDAFVSFLKEKQDDMY